MFGRLSQVLNRMRVVLATTSTQRHEILARTGVEFDIVPSDFDENLDRGKYDVTEFVELTALGKALKTRDKLKNDERQPDLIIALDTMVLCEGEMFGKPEDKEHAIELIRKLTSSTSHTVYTGVVLLYEGKVIRFTETTLVFMEKLTEEEILSYVDTGEPIRKAGGYAIQGIASSFIRKIEGDYNNVIGLPLCRITKELKALLLK